MKEERMSYSHQDWVKPGWRCASSSPPPLSLPETRWSPGSLPPISPTGETEQKHLRSSSSDMGSPLYRLSKADSDGAITKDKARCAEWGEFWTEASFSSSTKVLFKIIFWCFLKSWQEMKTICIHNFQCFGPQQTLCILESLHGSATGKKTVTKASRLNKAAEWERTSVVWPHNVPPNATPTTDRWVSHYKSIKALICFFNGLCTSWKAFKPGLVGYDPIWPRP